MVPVKEFVCSIAASRLIRFEKDSGSGPANEPTPKFKVLSSVNKNNSSGRAPPILVFAALKRIKLDNFPIFVETIPAKPVLFPKRRVVRSVKSYNASGTSPLNSLLSKYRDFIVRRFDISETIEPVKLLLSIRKSCKVSETGKTGSGPSKKFPLRCKMRRDGFCSRMYAGKLPSSSFLFNKTCSNVVNVDQSGNGPLIGSREIIKTVNDDNKETSNGKVPLILVDCIPYGRKRISSTV
mmetsp:Transcript_15940/g.27821  ORF Transcript_15940/g.27821 Transcript_15940/m.27821 type:complete len:238 (+) Transcript_15940:1597-2310(+)